MRATQKYVFLELPNMRILIQEFDLWNCFEKLDKLLDVCEICAYTLLLYKHCLEQMEIRFRLFIWVASYYYPAHQVLKR